MIYWDRLSDLMLKNKIIVSFSILMLVANIMMSITLFETRKGIRVTQIPFLQSPVEHLASDIPNEAIYNFAAIVWQHINTWETSGADDYSANIQRYGGYLDDEFRQLLMSNYQELKSAGQLSRTREIFPIASDYKPKEHVERLGSNIWSVNVTFKLKEYVNNTLIKDTVVTYPLMIRKGGSKNTYGMVISGIKESVRRGDV